MEPRISFFKRLLQLVVELCFAGFFIIGSLIYVPIQAYEDLFSRKAGVEAVILILIPPLSVIVLIGISSFQRKIGNSTIVKVTSIITCICVSIVGIVPGTPKDQEIPIFVIEFIMIYLPALGTWAGIVIVSSALSHFKQSENVSKNLPEK